MLIKDIYKKEYECKKCHVKIFYGKVATSDGKLVTKDGNAPNGKFGKDSNVLSAAVNKNGDLHPCYADYVKRDYQDMAIESPTTATAEPYKPTSVGGSFLDEELRNFEVDVNKAYTKLNEMARRYCGSAADEREVRICTMGLMHDFFQNRCASSLLEQV